MLPEIRLHLATEITPLWQASEDFLARTNLPPPFWAFCWAGGQALARHILDNPHIVAGRRVLDFASGGGVTAIAVALAGAAHVRAVEIDRFAVAALELNAALNRVAVEAVCEDVVGRASDADVVLAGDVCYERAMADGVTPWLRRLAAAGATVLLADPGRSYLPRRGLMRMAVYAVPTTLELEDSEVRETTVFQIVG